MSDEFQPARSIVTWVSPEKPSARAPAGVRSIMRPRMKGPRSLIVTTTVFPFLRLVTRTLVPKGNERCAAVSVWLLMRAPLAVFGPSLVE